MSTAKGGLCDICGRGPFAVVARHKAHVHPEWEPEHGSVTRYTQRHCRCSECKSAFAAWSRERAAAKEAAGESCPDCEFRSTAMAVLKHRTIAHGLVHGIESSYISGRCRCHACRQAHNLASRARKRNRGDLPRTDTICPVCGEGDFIDVTQHLRMIHGADTTPAHGTESRYKYGCRCAECRAESSARRAHFRRLRREAGGSQFFCAACGAPFETGVGQRHHERISHGIGHAGREAWRKAARRRVQLVWRQQSQRRVMRRAPASTSACRGHYEDNGGHRSMRICAQDVRHAARRLLGWYSSEQLVAVILEETLDVQP